MALHTYKHAYTHTYSHTKMFLRKIGLHTRTL